MTATEFDEWVAFSQLEPFGAWRDDYRAGLIASVVFNMNRAKGEEPRAPSDFMPLTKRQSQAAEAAGPSPLDVQQKLMSWLPVRRATLKT